MAVIDFRSNEIHVKIVYYEPGRGGKTTNLLAIHNFLGSHARGELLTINTRGDRTLLFDFLPMDLGAVGNFRINCFVVSLFA